MFAVQYNIYNIFIQGKSQAGLLAIIIKKWCFLYPRSSIGTQTHYMNSFHLCSTTSSLWNLRGKGNCGKRGVHVILFFLSDLEISASMEVWTALKNLRHCTVLSPQFLNSGMQQALNILLSLFTMLSLNKSHQLLWLQLLLMCSRFPKLHVYPIHLSLFSHTFSSKWVGEYYAIANPQGIYNQLFSSTYSQLISL